MKKIFSVLVVCLAAVMVMSLAACGEKTESKTKATETTTAAETTVAANNGESSAAEQQSEVNVQSDAQSEADNASQSELATEDADGYISEAVAIENVRKHVGAEAKILSYYKGYADEGPAWVITVQPVTTADGPEIVTYYSGYMFCYPVELNEASDNKTEDSDGYIDETAAIENVKSMAGSGAQIISSEKGYSPEGFEAWVITVQPVATDGNAEPVTYYSGYQFCYPATSN